ncbi:MAG: hypothetical protein ACLFTT_02895 [Candidatus Hydrogenedentota bacterium]
MIRTRTHMFWAAATALAVGLLLGSVAAAEDEDSGQGMPLVFADDFEAGTGDWIMTDDAAWKVKEADDSQVLALVAPSRYKPPVRSPLSIAWADVNVGDFVFEVKARQTGREYGHRDLCFFFGRQDADKFYYVHLATKADPHANSIFLVNEEPRVSIAEERTDGTDWGDTGSWHTIRIVRDTDSGRIAVYFDDLESPVMVAHDKHFTSGPIGLGSFDDTGYFDDVKVWGEVITEEEEDAEKVE